MLQIIKCFAKVPKSDTSVAWKIKGPGININNYYYLKIDETLVILRGVMENIELSNYEKVIKENIEYPNLFFQFFQQRCFQNWVDI